MRRGAVAVAAFVLGLWAGTVRGENLCPDPPSEVLPADGAAGVQVPAALEALVSDPDSPGLEVSFLGRPAPVGQEPFTLVCIPDTQYYSETYPENFDAQTNWVRDHLADLNIAFVTHLGDIVEDIDWDAYEWDNADGAMSVLDGVVPYGLAPGNHDMTIIGRAYEYEEHFPEARYENEPWYGGGRDENRSNYQLFSAGGLDFLVLHLEWEPDDDVLAWAAGILEAHPGRRAIVSTHIYLKSDGTRQQPIETDRPNGNSGEEIWDELVRGHCNVFMVVSAHYHIPPNVDSEARLTSTNDCGDPVHQVLQNYQDEPEGGNGWLRYYTFVPAEDRIYAYTYSPTLDAHAEDDNSRFVLDYTMGGSGFDPVGTDPDVAPGSWASSSWDSLAPETRYQWYVNVDDGACTTRSAVWSFTTGSDCTDPAPADDTCDGRDDDCDGTVDEDATAPPEVTGLRFTTADELAWDSLSGAVSYDAVRGDLIALAGGGDFTTSLEQCLADDSPASSLSDSESPLPGEGFYYLVRAFGCAHAGTYDCGAPSQAASRDASVGAAPSACP